MPLRLFQFLLKWTFFRKGTCLLPAFILIAGSLSAQSTGAIQGTVTDSTGAPIAGAAVVVSNQGTGEVHNLHTDSAGSYAQPSLVPGSYQVQVEAPGMQATSVRSVTVAVSTTTRQDVSLTVKSTSSTIEIQASAPVVESSSVSVGDVINQTTVQEIPLNGRHFADLAMLIPGSVTPPATGSLTAPLRGQGFFSFNSAGAREDQVNFMINGIQMNDMSQNQITFQPTINTVDEFKIDNSTYSAEYGRNSGSIVNIATRSGTNAYHGEAYEYLRNNFFDARNFSNPVGTRQSPFKRNQFGGDFGGAIKKDKTFLFLSYEQLEQRQSLPLTTNVLSSAQRAQAFSTSDPIIQKLVGLIPVANSPGSVFTSSAVAPVTIYQGTANFTQQFTESNRFNAYYAMQRDNRDEPPSTDGNNLPGFGDDRNGWRQLLTLNDTATLTPNLVNEARAGFNRIHIVFSPQTALDPVSYGINSGVTSAIGLPQISINGGPAFGGNAGFPQGRGDDTITLSDTMTWTRGTHTVSFGPEYHRVIGDSFSYTPGSISFSSFNSFLADSASSFSANTSNRSARIYINSIGAYVQDSWKVRPRLTLSLGLRYDWNGTPSEAENRFVIFNPSLDVLQRVGVAGGPAHAYNESALNFEPRFGFAWDAFGNGKTIVRSAYAIFIDQPNEGLVTGLASNPPFAIPLTYTPSAGTILSFSNAYSLAGGSVAPTSVAMNYRNANVQSWNFNIQQAFGRDYGLMLGYFGSKGTDLNIARNYNQFINGVRPYPTLSLNSSIDPGARLGNISVYESDGNSSYNALWASLKKHFSSGLQFEANYTYSKSIDDNSRDIQGVVIQDSYNIAGDRGLSDFDARQRIVLNGVYTIPFHSNRLVSGWEIALIETAQSGNPLNFHTTNTTFTGNGNLRPSISGPVITGFTPAVNGNAAYITYVQDPSVFYTANGGNAFGNLGRNAVTGPGFFNTDVSLVKNTKLFGTEERPLNLQFRADAFDVLNQTNFFNPNTTYPSGVFGVITGGTRFPTGDSGSSRQLQLALKLVF